MIEYCDMQEMQSALSIFDLKKILRKLSDPS